MIRDAARGLDFFRSTVIEAIGDYKIAAAVARLTAIAKIDGPLQDDAATALGKIGDKSALGALAELQRTASKESQPAIAAAICLMGTNCSAHVGYLEKTLTFADTYPGYQELLRGAAAGLGRSAGCRAPNRPGAGGVRVAHPQHGPQEPQDFPRNLLYLLTEATAYGCPHHEQHPGQSDETAR